MASVAFVCKTRRQERLRHTVKMCTGGGKERLSSLKRFFQMLWALPPLSCVPLAARLPPLPVRSVVKHTHAEPHLPPSLQPIHPEPKRERRQDRSMLKSQLNRSKERLVGWEVASPPVHPSPTTLLPCARLSFTSLNKQTQDPSAAL